MPRRNCSGIASVALLVAVVAQIGRAADTVELDRSGLAESDPAYFVHIVARKSPYKVDGKPFPGHAYVVWEIRRSGNQTASDRYEAWGFYPKSAQEDFTKLDFEGALKEEALSGEGTGLDAVRLRVKVTKQAFDQSKQAIKRFDGKNIKYENFTRNCVHFADLTAKSLGLKASSADRTLPASYVKSLIDLNSE